MNTRSPMRAVGVGLALGLLAAPALAQMTPVLPATSTAAMPAVIPTPATPSTPAPSTAAPPATAETTPAVRSISLQAGTGVLLRLPLPAATVMSAQPAIARVQPASPTSLFLMAVAPGRTTLIATNETGAAIAQYDVTVAPPPTPPHTEAPGMRAGEMMPIVPQPAAAAAPVTVTPETAGKIRTAIATMVAGAADIGVVPAGHTVILHGSVPNATAAAQAESIAHGFLPEGSHIIDELAVMGRLQVNVRVRIAEIDRSITRELGFNWQALGNSSGWRLGLLTGAAAAGPISVLSALGTTPLGNVPAGQIGVGYTNSHGSSIDGLIDALAQDQLITILAEPNLTALSGETASFLAGGEFPIPVAGSTSNGSVQISVDFKQYGVSLSLVPTVLADNRINLRIRPEVSELSTTGAVSMPIGTGVLTIPALTVRRAETTIELGSGQSFAIAGLLQKTSTDLTNAIPGLGETPVLGALFKSNSFQRGQSELVIVVTPYIVRPVARPQMLAAPTDNFAPATDLDRLLLGRQVAASAGARPLDAGFILK